MTAEHPTWARNASAGKLPRYQLTLRTKKAKFGRTKMQTQRVSNISTET